MISRGVFLTSTQPADTAAFYRDVAGLALQEVGSADSYVYWKVDDGRMHFAIHDAKAFTDYSFPPVAKSTTWS